MQFLKVYESAFTLDAYDFLLIFGKDGFVRCLWLQYGIRVHKISIFWFLKDKTLRKKWIQRLKRGKSDTRNFAPNVHSKLCMKHFKDDQFVISPSLAVKIWLSGVGRVQLKPGAVPTIFEVPGKMDSKDRVSPLGKEENSGTSKRDCGEYLTCF